LFFCSADKSHGTGCDTGMAVMIYKAPFFKKIAMEKQQNMQIFAEIERWSRCNFTSVICLFCSQFFKDD
jgi:hypothetical protein